MVKKQKSGDFIKHLLIKSLMILTLLFSVITVSIVFAESNGNNQNQQENNKSNQEKNEKTFICHATASQKNPYVFLEVDSNSVDGEGANSHSSHTDDIISITDLNGDGDIDIDDCNFMLVKPAPIANDDSYSVEENSVLHISAPGLLANDENVSEPDITTTKLSDASHGSLVVHDEGSFIYTPEENYHGADSFSYKVCINDLCDDGQVNITVDFVNNAPVANDDFATANKNTPVVIDVLHDDIDVENNIDPASVTVVSSPSNGVAIANSDGTITYTPNQDYVGSDTFTYGVCDLENACSQAEAKVTVETIEGEVTTNITAGQDSAETNEDTPITIAVLDNDVDAGDGTLHISLIEVGALHGITEIVGSAVVYTPDSDYFGADSFTYLVCDNQDTPVCVESSPVSVEILPINDAPVVNDDFVTVKENDLVIIHASHDDYDVEDNIDPHSITIVASSTNGIAVVNNEDTITYTPNIDFSGTDQMTYQICDFDGACDTADIIITIIAADHPPVTANDTLSLFANKSEVVDVLANDTSSVGDLYAGSIVSPPDHGTAVINQDNTITYTPAVDFIGEDIFTYSACDSNDHCSSGVVTITISAENTTPVANDDFATANKNTPVVINVLHDDTDAENNIDLASVTVASAPSHGTAVVNSDGTITYTPNQDYVGSDTFTYSVCDLENACSQAATVTVETTENGGATRSLASPLIPVVSEPLPAVVSGGGGGGGSSTYFALTAVNDEISIHKNIASSTISVLANDTPTNIAISKIIANPLHGTATISGTDISYIPQAGFVGEDVLIYLVCRTDNSQICSDAKVTVYVYDTNTAPVAHNDMASVHGNGAVIIYVLANDIDGEYNIDTGSLAITAFPANGVVVADKISGAITYYTNVGFIGTDSFSYSVCDSDNKCATASVPIEVFDVMRESREEPADTVQVLINTAKTIEVPLSKESELIRLHVSSHNGTIIVNDNGTFTYAPEENYIGEDHFSYLICSKADETICNEHTINIAVLKNKKVAPIAQCQSYLLEYIKLGAKNNPVEVKKLQEFLKTREGFEDINISGIYDQKTYNYVKQFQSDYMKDVLVPWKLSVPTGYVFETTKKKINELYCSCEKYLKEYIKFGAQNNPSEVEKLQHFLKDYEGHSNIGITGIYDEQTYVAVKEFQTKYIDDVLTPWDHSTPTGYVYKTTRQKINELYCKYIKEI